MGWHSPGSSGPVLDSGAKHEDASGNEAAEGSEAAESHPQPEPNAEGALIGKSTKKGRKGPGGRPKKKPKTSDLIPGIEVLESDVEDSRTDDDEKKKRRLPVRSSKDAPQETRREFDLPIATLPLYPKPSIPHIKTVLDRNRSATGVKMRLWRALPEAEPRVYEYKGWASTVSLGFDMSMNLTFLFKRPT